MKSNLNEIPSQMKYIVTYFDLIEHKRKSTFRKVATIHGVNVSTVSRAFNECITKGIITAEYKLSPYGKALLNNYVFYYERISKWLQKQGLNEELAKNQAEVLIESCESSAIDVFSKLGEMYIACENIFRKYENVKTFNGNLLNKFMEYGRYDVPFTFYKNKNSDSIKVSMANNAFDHPGKMVINGDSYIKLNSRDVKKKSKLNGVSLIGELSSAKYIFNGYEIELEIVNGTIKVPLEAIVFSSIEDGNSFEGSVELILSCSVGLIHMPESKCILCVRI